jgi:hypothetical protein
VAQNLAAILSAASEVVRPLDMVPYVKDDAKKSVNGSSLAGSRTHKNTLSLGLLNFMKAIGYPNALATM